jgi:nuclear protein localization family protein 4
LSVLVLIVKFLTGDSNNQIHFEGYQVSNQCMALVRDGCIVPTYDVPQLAYIKESTNEQFVPDVYYRVILSNSFESRYFKQNSNFKSFKLQEKDNYNNEVTKIARPLPVEYLLTDLSVGFPRESFYKFNENLSYINKQFPIENRTMIQENQVNSL